MTMKAHLSAEAEAKLTQLLARLVDQQAAWILVRPNRDTSGFWFGGGNLARAVDGTIWMPGRYRNYGDSRTGLAAGERGLECAVFKSTNGGRSFKKVWNWAKTDLSAPDREILSIEGTALHFAPDGRCELFVASEKRRPYPAAVAQYMKPNCGVWSIDRITGGSVDTIEADTIRPVLEEATDPAYLQVKDPLVFDNAKGETQLLFCSHPYTWTSANTGLAVRKKPLGEFRLVAQEILPRGPAWDVAVTRLTDRLSVPAVGMFADQPPVSVYFYDGAECVHQHEQSPFGVIRSRGYSGEELGGACVGVDGQFPKMQRLSRLEPLFVSPWGSGSSRFLHTLVTEDGIFAAWQQSQPDYSQPLVGHFLPMAEVRQILGG